MNIEQAEMSGDEEMTSQRKDEAGGKQTGRGKETVAGRGIGNAMHLHPSKLSDSSMTSAAGKIASDVKKTKTMILDSLKVGAATQMLLLLTKRSPTLNCQGHSQKTQTHSGEW